MQIALAADLFRQAGGRGRDDSWASTSRIDGQR
jgi:hypothetical protein